MKISEIIVVKKIYHFTDSVSKLHNTQIYLSNINCEDCRYLVTSGLMEKSSLNLAKSHDTEEEIAIRQDFLSLVSRGGLKKPSDLLYVTIVHAWSLYMYIKTNQNLHKMMLSSRNPGDLFVKTFIQLLEDFQHTDAILYAKCPQGHNFKSMIQKAVIKLFHIMAKNYTAEQNDKIHLAKKRDERAMADHKKSSSARKIKKLSSS